MPVRKGCSVSGAHKKKKRKGFSYTATATRAGTFWLRICCVHGHVSCPVQHASYLFGYLARSLPPSLFFFLFLWLAAPFILLSILAIGLRAMLR